MQRIMFAGIDDAYSLYYLTEDPEGRWIITDDAGVAATNFNIPEELAEVAARGEAIIADHAGEAAIDYLDGVVPADKQLSEAECLMIEWGWLEQASDEAQDVITWQAAGAGRTDEINVTPKQEAEALKAMYWPRNRQGYEYSQVAMGLHRAYPTYTDRQWARMIEANKQRRGW